MFADLDGDELSYEIVAAPWQLNLRLVGGQRLEFQPVANYNLPDGVDVAIEANDHHGATVTDTFRVTIVPVNDPPNAFNLIAPADSSRVRDYQVRFMWEAAVDVERDPVFYNLYLGIPGDGGDTLIFPDLSDTYLSVGSLDTLMVSLNIYREVTAFWWVIASDRLDQRSSATQRRIIIPRVVKCASRWPGTSIGIRPESSFPNPFNGIASIAYDLPAAGAVAIRIFDRSGRLVSILNEGNTPPGRHTITWNAAGLPSGVYLIQLRAGENLATREAVLIR